MAAFTATNAATWLPEVWSSLSTDTYRGENVMTGLLDRRWEKELGVGRGDTVNVPGFTQNNSPRNRGAGTGTFGTAAALTADATTESQVQIAVNRLYYKFFQMPVENSAQIMPSYLTKLIDGNGQAIALQVDTDILADNTNGVDAATTVVGVDNIDVTEDDLITIETNLHSQNAPQKDRYLVVSQGTRGSLLKIEAFRNSLYQGAMGNLDGSKGQGYLGPLLSFQAYMSTHTEAGTSGSKNGAFQREWNAYIEQVGLRAEKDLNIEDGLLNQYITYNVCGFKIIKAAYCNELDGK